MVDRVHCNTPNLWASSKPIAAAGFADDIGYPIMLKATSGGGGRGIRRCDNADELRRNYDRVISEAEKAFGNAEVFIEKFIANPRHIEVQILADQRGNMVHFGSSALPTLTVGTALVNSV